MSECKHAKAKHSDGAYGGYIHCPSCKLEDAELLKSIQSRISELEKIDEIRNSLFVKKVAKIKEQKQKIAELEQQLLNLESLLLRVADFDTPKGKDRDSLFELSKKHFPENYPPSEN